ncbi:MAG: AI-2E family transporter [Steroidobacteraceae bacterium]
MDSDFYRKSFLVGTVIVLGYALVRVLDPFLGALGWAAFVAFLGYPLHRALTLRLAGRENLSAGLLTALTLVFVMAPLALLAGVFTDQVLVLARTLQQAHLQLDTSKWLLQLEHYAWFASAAEWIRANLTITTEQLRGWAIEGAQSFLKGAAAGGGQFLLGAAGTLFGFFLMLFLLFFLLRDGARMFEVLVRLIPLEPRRRRALIAHLGNVARAVVFGTVLTALLQGLLVGIGFAIAGLPSPVVFGVLSAIIALLPAVGTPLIWMPAVIYLAAVDRWGMAIFLGLWGLGITFSDNVLRPLLISRSAPVSPLAMFVGVIGGIAAFGPIGLVAGPVFVSLVVELLRFAEESFGQRD